MRSGVWAYGATERVFVHCRVLRLEGRRNWGGGRPPRSLTGVRRRRVAQVGCMDVSRCAGGCAETRIKAPVVEGCMSGRQDQYGWHWSYMYRTVGLSEGHTAPSSKTLKFGRYGLGYVARPPSWSGLLDPRTCVHAHVWASFWQHLG